jgi:molybdopterin adenylyltransferase
MSTVPIGIVVSSDRAAAGVYEDRGGPAIKAYLTRVLTTPWSPHLHVVADEQTELAEILIRLCDEECCPLVLTTGSTGPAPRDVLPEVMNFVCERFLPGFGEEMRRASLREVPTSILSRQTAGTRGASLIINLPGKPAAIQTCLDAVFAAVPYCIDLIGGARLETDPAVCRAFRPRV